MEKMYKERKQKMVKTLRVKEQEDTKNLVAKQTDQMYTFLETAKKDIKIEFTKEIKDNMVYFIYRVLI